MSLQFYKLPSNIRVMIWNMKNREEKFENLNKENDYNKKLFIFEYKQQMKEWGIHEKGLDSNMKLLGVIVCPRINDMIYDELSNTWFRWGDNIDEGNNGCSTSWLEEPTKECKESMLERMIECFERGITYHEFCKECNDYNNKIFKLIRENKYNKKLLSFELKSFCEWNNNGEKIIKPSFQVICPRVGQVIVFDDGNVWINQDNSSSYTWLEDRKISTKKDMIEIMIEEMKNI